MDLSSAIGAKCKENRKELLDLDKQNRPTAEGNFVPLSRIKAYRIAYIRFFALRAATFSQSGYRYVAFARHFDVILSLYVFFKNIETI